MQQQQNIQDLMISFILLTFSSQFIDTFKKKLDVDLITIQSNKEGRKFAHKS